METRVSSAADFAAAEEVFELPFPQNGKRLAVRIRALDLDEFAAAEEAPPTYGPTGDRILTTGDQRSAIAKFRGVAQAGIVEPKFSFDYEGPAPRWSSLVAGNQTAIAVAIYRLSGIGASPDG